MTLYNANPRKILLFLSAAALFAGSGSKVRAESDLDSDAPASSGTKVADAAPVNVEAIKEKYWARGDETELGVVQNRAYSKANRFQVGLLGGMITSDPFLNVTTTGLTLGYHFSEYFAASLIGWKTNVSGSSALDTFEDFSGATANVNRPESYIGAEGSGSLLYGKLSVLGAAIIYYDLHVSGGLGLTLTESGNYLTPSAGIGQRFYLNKTASLRLDYRLMFYRETIIEKVVPTKLGEPRGERSNWTNSITLGVDFMLDI